MKPTGLPPMIITSSIELILRLYDLETSAWHRASA